MQAGLVQTFRAFAYNNAWANHRLLTACGELSQAEFAAARTGFFPSLQATLNHIHVIDLFYVDALEGGWLGPMAWANEVPCPSVGELKRAVRGVSDKMLIQQLKELEADGIVTRNDYREVPPRVDYTLTPLGHSLAEALTPLCNWGSENMALVAQIFAERATWSEEQRA